MRWSWMVVMLAVARRQPPFSSCWPSTKQTIDGTQLGQLETQRHFDRSVPKNPLTIA
jgi:hypothetical protein